VVEDPFDRDRYLGYARERIVRQEQAIAHLAACGCNTTLAEKRLVSLRRPLDAMLQRRQARAEEQANTPCVPAPGQLGPVERDGQSGSEAP